MLISFYVNPVAGGWKPTDQRLGGTEESIVEWSKRLAKRGHQVSVFHNSPDGFYEEYEGVVYEDHSRYIGRGDICINVKSSDISPREPTIYLTNETNAADHDLRDYLGVIWPSHWAADNIPVNNPNLYILPHGYDKAEIYPVSKYPKQCFYASSPDRGLDTLLKVWPRVYAAHPDARLLVTYGANGLSIPGVMFLGEVPPEMMNDIYRTSDIWCHPCNGGELFCIVGVKAQVAQCVPVIIPTMALGETVRDGYFTTEAEYADTLIGALNDTDTREYVRESLAKEHYADWDESTDMLENIIHKALAITA